MTKVEQGTGIIGVVGERIKSQQNSTEFWPWEGAQMELLFHVPDLGGGFKMRE